VKAIQLYKTGGPEVLEYVELPAPVPAAGEVLVRAHAIGVGWPDVLLRTGVYRWMPPLPAIPGAELSGRVEAVGPGVEGLRIGQPVLVYDIQRMRCYAELAAVPARAVTALPEGIDLDDAVSIPNYEVAWALLYEAARGVRVRRVYINGAAGGVGSALVQLCVLTGWQVIGGASSAEKCAFARSQGASHTVDYSREAVVDSVRALTGGAGVDLVLDHIIGPRFTDNLRMLAPMGMIVSFNALGGLPQEDLFRAMRQSLPVSPAVRCFTMHSFDGDAEARHRIATAVIELFARGAVRPALHRKLPLAEAREAHAMLGRREVLGKLVLNPTA
jgi:NADPH2:quinone reductase